MDDNTNINDTSITEDTQDAVTLPSPECEATPPERKKLPLVCKIIYAIAALCVLLYIAFVLFPDFSDFFNYNISPIIRVPLAKLTGWIPFSLSEFIVILLPLIIGVIVYFGVKHYSSSWRNVGVFCLTVLSVAAYVFSTFTLGFLPAYRGSTLDVKMGLNKQPVSADELYETAQIVVDKLGGLVYSVDFKEKEDFSVMPYGYSELNDKLIEAYDKASEKYDFIQSFDSRVKRIMLSEPMTYTHISGVYTFFTGEANINTNFPDYTIPFTAAHELAHQRGIAREDEANFVAFLVCSEADDAYIRYSAYLNLFEYLAGPLNSANPQYYSLIYAQLPENSKLEMSAYSKFFDKYRENIAEKVSDKVNDTFLTINGTEGVKSYGMVVDLAVAYYKDK
ncbi:MAG: DUF3810 domain-containing protein [Ruminococcaceae bacterium]|nr:DUF3810 domain-containing protein [Oscillospiraceae bacterium]